MMKLSFVLLSLTLLAASVAAVVIVQEAASVAAVAIVQEPAGNGTHRAGLTAELPSIPEPDIKPKTENQTLEEVTEAGKTEVTLNYMICEGNECVAFDSKANAIIPEIENFKKYLERSPKFHAAAEILMDVVAAFGERFAGPEEDDSFKAGKSLLEPPASAELLSNA
jgi:hypothetical protein